MVPVRAVAETHVAFIITREECSPIIRPKKKKNDGILGNCKVGYMAEDVKGEYGICDGSHVMY